MNFENIYIIQERLMMGKIIVGIFWANTASQILIKIFHIN